MRGGITSYLVFVNLANTRAGIWKMLLVVEKGSRRLNAEVS